MNPSIDDLYKMKDIDEAYGYAKENEKFHPGDEEALRLLGYILAQLIARNRAQNKPYENYYQEMKNIREGLPLSRQLEIDRYYVKALNKFNLIDHEVFNYVTQLFNEDTGNAPSLGWVLCYLIQKKMRLGEDASDYINQLHSIQPYFNPLRKTDTSLIQEILNTLNRDRPRLEYIYQISEKNIVESLELFSQFLKDNKDTKNGIIESYKIKFTWQTREKIKSLRSINDLSTYNYKKSLLKKILDLNSSDQPFSDELKKALKFLLWEAYHLSKDVPNGGKFHMAKFLQRYTPTHNRASIPVVGTFNPYFDSSIKKEENSWGGKSDAKTMLSLAHRLFKQGIDDALLREDQADIYFMLKLLLILTRKEPKNGFANLYRVKGFKSFCAYDPKIFKDTDFNPSYDSRNIGKEDAEDLSIASRMIRARLKYILTLEISKKREDLQNFMPYLDLLIEKEPKNIWPVHYKAKSLRLLGNLEEARKLALQVLKENRKDSWRWGALGEVSEGDEAIASLCKAIDTGSSANHKLKMKELLLPHLIQKQYYTEASIEIRDICWLYENQEKTVPKKITKLKDEPWFSLQEGTSNHLFYTQKALLAPDILCGDLPWRRGEVNAYEYQGQTKYEVFIEGSPFALQAKLPASLINFKDKFPPFIRVRGENLNGRFEIYQAEPLNMEQEFETSPEHLAIISGINEIKKRAYLFVNETCKFSIPLSKFSNDVKPGEVFEVRLAQNESRYSVINFKKSDKTFPEKYICNFSGYLHLHHKGYGFISSPNGDIHVRMELVKMLERELTAIKLSSHIGSSFFEEITDDDLETQKIKGLALLEDLGFSALTLSIVEEEEEEEEEEQ